MDRSLPLSSILQKLINSGVLTVHFARNDAIHKFTTINSNTAEAPISFGQSYSSQKNEIVSSLTWCKMFEAEKIIMDYHRELFQSGTNPVGSGGLAFKDCVFCKSTFTSDSLRCED